MFPDQQGDESDFTGSGKAPQRRRAGKMSGDVPAKHSGLIRPKSVFDNVGQWVLLQRVIPDIFALNLPGSLFL
jgi:hypothetical protein